jgi:hypothetical protein
MHNEEFRNLLSSSNIIRPKENDMICARSMHRRDENTCKIFDRRPKRTWEDNVRLGLQEFMCECMDWIRLTHDGYQLRALVNKITGPRFP